MTITPAYTAVFGLLYVVLSVRALRLRRRLDVPVGTGEEPVLTKALRAHANFAEYVPLALLLIFFLETRTGPSIWIHILCGSLFAGRLLHAYGISQVEEDYRFRVAGMALTFVALVAASMRLLVGLL